MEKQAKILKSKIKVLTEIVDEINRIKCQTGAMSELVPTRAVSIAKTKLDEAVLWLQKELAENIVTLEDLNQ